ncbi:MAG: FtsW/RodA/SpoVE family cell cycle protein, partial [Bacteroidota bacterium]|nr:FtsW/RodA/SpoVE family cell cycle protein [Bacteroidota bacterium]MDX5506520.1 FtsW/RodA/SpoVE family cell cycle protein [Bacteroidota bacterium]
MRHDKSTFGRIDWTLVLLFLLLVLMGWLNIYAAVYNEEHSNILDVSQKYGKQLIWILTSLGIAGSILLIDGRFFEKLAYPIFITTCALLVLVLLFGKEVNGARSWFAIGSFSLQPSEFAKFATCLA